MGFRMIATCALNWRKSLYSASEFSAAVSAARPINLVLHLVLGTPSTLEQGVSDSPVLRFVVLCVAATKRSKYTESR